VSRSGAKYFTAVVFLVLATGSVALPYEPSPGRDFILVTDFRAGCPIGLSVEQSRKLDLSTELGLLFTLDRAHHLGPVVMFGSWLNGGWHSRWGLSARYRMQLGERLSLDLSPGLILSDSPYPDGFAGFTAEIALVLDGWIGLEAGLDATESYPDGTDTVLRLGLSLGRMPGLCATAAAGTAGAVAWWMSDTD
jgi:hypothetical protein